VGEGIINNYIKYGYNRDCFSIYRLTKGKATKVLNQLKKYASENNIPLSLRASVSNNISIIAPLLYLQTMLILYNIGRINEGFVHGDLNPGNLFILPRPKSHAQCRMEGPPSEALDFMPGVFKFNEPYYVKMIDFGSSESYLLSYSDNPVAGKSII
jgi:hypothetical protein